jgi:hypothetical protein
MPHLGEESFNFVLNSDEDHAISVAFSHERVVIERREFRNPFLSSCEAVAP